MPMVIRRPSDLTRRGAAEENISPAGSKGLRNVEIEWKFKALNPQPP
jgi:hypothetical protein